MDYPNSPLQPGPPWPSPHSNTCCWQLMCLQQIPSIFGQELTYYEDICKIRGILKKILEENINQVKDIDDLKKAIEEINQIIETWEAGGKEIFLQWLKENFPQLVYFGLTNSGYFVAYLPEQWSDIKFGTTGLDIETALMSEYGHLTISY